MASRSGFSLHGYRTWKTGGCKHGISCTIDQDILFKSNCSIYVSYIISFVISSTEAPSKHSHLHLLPLNRRHNLPRMLNIPKLQIPNALPRPRIQPAIRDRNRDTRAHQGTLHMRGHIIRALGIMPIQSFLAAWVLGHDAVQRVGHVGAHVRVEVLIERERAGCVLDEEIEESGLVGFYLGELFEDVLGYEVGAARAGGEGEGFLEPGVC
jgi:hypothetical protein